MKRLDRIIETLQTQPLVVFAAIGGVLLVAGPIVASLLIHPLPLETWLEFCGNILVFAGAIATAVFIRKSSGWTSWGAAFALAMQCVLAVYLITVGVSCLKGPIGPPLIYQALICIGGALWLLMAAGLMIRNHWAGFALEFLMGMAIFLFFLFVDPETGDVGWRWRIALDYEGIKNSMVGFSVLMVIGKIGDHGIARWRLAMRKP